MNKYTPLIFILIAFMLVSCGSSEAEIATSVAQTLEAQSTETPLHTPTATSTQEPMNPPTPTNTEAVPQTAEEISREFLELITEFIEDVDGVESVNLMRFKEGRLDIELRTKWTSRDRQTDVSFDVIRLIAVGLIQGGFSEAELLKLAGGDSFSVHLVTYSTDGDYRYESDTDFETLRQLDALAISYDEWLAAANAGFR